MRRYVKITVIFVVCAVLLLSIYYGIGYKSFKEKGMWQDFPGIFTAYEPEDLKLYRQILPEEFDMPILIKESGAGNSAVPNPYALFNSITDKHTNVADVNAPNNSPSCCFLGVAPSKKPVFKSCDVSPAIDAAIATTQPTVIAAVLPMSPVQP